MYWRGLPFYKKAQKKKHIIFYPCYVHCRGLGRIWPYGSVIQNVGVWKINIISTV